MKKLPPRPFWFLVIAVVATPLLADEPGSVTAALRAAGLTDVNELEPSIKGDLKYSTGDNFLHANVYGDLSHCFLRPDAAVMLKKAQALLQQKRPGYSLLVLDCARPRHIQRRMWEVAKDTPQRPYVAEPEKGSIHNFGMAVDLTIVSVDGRPLDMGTPFDFFGKLAEPRLEAGFLKSGELTTLQVENRKLLRSVMTAAGFHVLPIEWWHFDALPKDQVRARFSIID